MDTGTPSERIAARLPEDLTEAEEYELLAFVSLWLARWARTRENPLPAAQAERG